MSTSQKIRIIADYGRRYSQEFLADWRSQRAQVMTDSRLAMRRWFNCSFMRGRRDEVSIAFLRSANAAVQNVEQRLAAPSGLASIWNSSARAALDAEIRTLKVNHAGDRTMVLASFDLVSRTAASDGYNLVARASRMAQAGNLVG